MRIASRDMFYVIMICVLLFLIVIVEIYAKLLLVNTTRGTFVNARMFKFGKLYREKNTRVSENIMRNVLIKFILKNKGKTFNIV